MRKKEEQEVKVLVGVGKGNMLHRLAEASPPECPESLKPKASAVTRTATHHFLHAY